MMRHFLLGLCLLCGNAMAQDQFTVLILGDSLTEGYGLQPEESFPSLIEQRLRNEGHQVRVINGGVSGSTSASAVDRLRWYIRAEPDLMLLALGANDGLRGLSIEQLRQNLEDTIVLAQENGLQVALAGMQIPPNYGRDYAEAFAAVYPELAEQYDLPLLPFLLEDVAAVPELNLPDGIHPNAAGNRIIARHVHDFLLPLLSSQH